MFTIMLISKEDNSLSI